MRMLSFLLLGALAILPPPSRADDTASLLARHKAFTGWQFNDDQTHFLQMTDTVTNGTEIVKTQEIKRIGALFRADTHEVKSAVNWSTGFTGNLFWYSDENGFTVPIVGGTARARLAEDLFFVDGYAQMPWTSARTEQRWNATYNVVHLQAPSAAAVDLYVDPASGQYGGIVIDPKGDHEKTIHVLDYQTQNEKRFVGRWQVDGEKSIHGASNIRLGAPLTGDDLHPPRPAAHWDFTNATPFKIRLTSDRIIVTARVNGVEGQFLLDSGASSLFLSGAFARRAGIKAQGHATTYTLYGSEQNDSGIADSLEIGGNTLHNVTLYFGSGAIDDAAPDGLLGFDLLAGAFVSVDFQQSTVQIQDPTAVDESTVPGVHIAVDLSSGVPFTEMGVQGKTATVNALLDTGSPRVILIDPQLLYTYGLHITAAGVLGGCGLLDDMTLGPIVYDKPNACTVPDFGLHNALLGYDFLKGLGKLHFDYLHAAMILAPQAK